MTEFVASNGEVVCTENGWVYSRGMAVGPDSVRALREFFQAERDAELSRWRWPENPDYVVYRRGTGWLVLDETTGATKHYSYRSHAAVGNSLLSQAARAYFEAHPERKPWHDAKPGEVWLIELNGFDEEIAVVVDGTGEFQGSVATLSLESESIPAGRRLWPEG